MLSLFLYLAAGFLIWGAWLSILLVGKPRAPISGPQAAVSVFLTAAIVIALLVAARALS